MLFILISIFVCFHLSAQYVEKFSGEEIYRTMSKKRLKIVSKFIGENPTIFEAGGHYGIDTLKMAKKWPEGKIITFEPNPNAYKILLSNIKDSKNVLPVNLALNNYNGKAVLNICYGTNGDNPVYEGASSLLPASSGMVIHYQGPKVEVDCTILDNWCIKNKIYEIDFMWLDLEGLELQILKSSPKILSTVKAICIETNFYEFRIGMTQFNNLQPFLEQSGFKLIAHWYTEGLQGDAIFVKKELLNIFNN